MPRNPPTTSEIDTGSTAALLHFCEAFKNSLVLVFVLRAVLHRIGFSSVFASSPLAELSLYVSLFGLLILLF